MTMTSPRLAAAPRLLLASPRWLPARRARRGRASAPAPDFTLRSMDGRNLRLQEQRGQVVMVNFWATWCGPCRQEMPHLNRLYDKYRAAGFVLLGVNIDDDAAQRRRPGRQAGPEVPGAAGHRQEVSRLYDLSAMPATVLIDRDGRVRHLHRGYRDGYEADLRPADPRAAEGMTMTRAVPHLLAALRWRLLRCSAAAPSEPWVKPYERERLADPIMKFSRDALADKHREHVYDVREGARGATGVQGRRLWLQLTLRGLLAAPGAAAGRPARRPAGGRRRARRRRCPRTRAEAMFHVYNGGGVTATGPALLVRKSLADTVSLSGSYYVDAVSNASIDVVTTASPYKETRTAYGLGARLRGARLADHRWSVASSKRARLHRRRASAWTWRRRCSAA